MESLLNSTLLFVSEQPALATLGFLVLSFIAFCAYLKWHGHLPMKPAEGATLKRNQEWSMLLLIAVVAIGVYGSLMYNTEGGQAAADTQQATSD